MQSKSSAFGTSVFSTAGTRAMSNAYDQKKSSSSSVSSSSIEATATLNCEAKVANHEASSLLGQESSQVCLISFISAV